MILVLDTFGDNGEVTGMGEGDEGPNERLSRLRVVGAGVDGILRSQLIDEGLIDLHDVDGEAG